MKTSNGIVCSLILVLVLGCLPACGSAGPADNAPDASALSGVRFTRGDLELVFGELFVLFGPGGAPVDGILSPIQSEEQEFDAAVEQLIGINLVLLYVMTPHSTPFIDAAILLDFFGRIDFAAAEEFTHKLWGCSSDDCCEDIGPLVARPTWITLDQTNNKFTLGSALPSSGRFGTYDTGLELGFKRTFIGDGTADLELKFDILPDSTYEADRILIKIGGNIIQELGPVKAGDPQLSTTLNRSEFDLELQIEFLPRPGTWYEDIGVDISLLPPPLTARAVAVGSVPEDVWPIGNTMWNATHPANPIGPGEFAAILSGRHHALAGFSSPTGFAEIDLRSQPVDPGDTTYRSATIGLAPGASYPLQGKHTPDHVVAAQMSVGSWGLSIANFDNATMQFAADSVVDIGNMTDLSAFNGDPQSGEAVYVDNSADAIKFIGRDALDQYITVPSATITNAAWPGASGAVVSAFRHTSGDLLFITDGDPGEFWVKKPGLANATRIGAVGTAPRNVRAAGNIAAIGSFGSGLGFGAIHFFVRSTGGVWDYAPLSKAGPKSVGIDVKQLPDGRVAVAYPSYNDNSLNITLLDNNDGGILDDQTLALPAGNLQPGHCAFARDDLFDAVFVSCNGSDSLVLMPVSYPP